MTTTTKTPGQVVTALEFAEVDSRLAVDCRDVLRRERESLTLALRSGDGREIKAAKAEAERVAVMWQVEL